MKKEDIDAVISDDDLNASAAAALLTFSEPVPFGLTPEQATFARMKGVIAYYYRKGHVDAAFNEITSKTWQA